MNDTYTCNNLENPSQSLTLCLALHSWNGIAPFSTLLADMLVLPKLHSPMRTPFDIWRAVVLSACPPS